MSLNWNLTKVKNHDRVCFTNWKKDENGELSGTMKPVTNSLIWITMSIGMGEITEKNYDEFFMRIEILQKALDKPYLVSTSKKTGKHKPYYITLEHVKQHIGLRTNVFPMETRSKWMKRMVEHYIFENAREEYKKQEKALMVREAWRENKRRDKEAASVNS